MNVTLDVITAPIALLAGVAPGQLSLSITDASGKPVNDTNGNTIAAQRVDGTSGTFANVPDGTYLASAVRLDSSGNSIGTAVTQAFAIPAPAPTTYDAPQSIAVTLA